MRIVRGTRRGGSLDMTLAPALGVAVVVPLAGNLVVPLAGSLVVPLAVPGTVVVARALDGSLAVPLIVRSPVPGR
ncbi:hypothetical protein AB0N99_18815 [Streptomyces sp. NPDC093272]|uniref:hypothetical protein n=1 Tax=Streptomyces sp. NPDC093272 TaxID=3154981 RepID=UPI003444604F